MFTGDFDEAIDWAEKAISRRPEFLESHLVLTACLGYADKEERAIAALEDCRRIDPNFGDNFTKLWPFHSAEQLAYIVDGLHKAGWEG